MFGKTQSKKAAYGIVGLGRFGQALAEELAASGAELIVLERDAEKVREMRELTDNAYVVKSLDKKSLQETGIQNCDVAVVCISEQMDTSILTTLNLVSLGIPRVIAKATSAEHGIILEKLGAEVVYPERDMAVRLAGRLASSLELDMVRLSERVNISSMHVPDQLVGKTVAAANLRPEFGLNIIAIENRSTVLDTIRPDYMFQTDDVLFLAGSREGLLEMNQWVATQNCK